MLWGNGAGSVGVLYLRDEVMRVGHGHGLALVVAMNLRRSIRL